MPSLKEKVNKLLKKIRAAYEEDREIRRNRPTPETTRVEDYATDGRDHTEDDHMGFLKYWHYKATGWTAREPHNDGKHRTGAGHHQMARQMKDYQRRVSEKKAARAARAARAADVKATNAARGSPPHEHGQIYSGGKRLVKHLLPHRGPSNANEELDVREDHDAKEHYGKAELYGKELRDANQDRSVMSELQAAPTRQT